MYPLLLAAGIVLLALVGRREHLTFNDQVKDIRNTVDQAEQDRIFQMAPTSLQRAASTANAQGGYPVDKSKVILAQIIRDFQKDVYAPATAPITETVVDNFVSTKRTAYQANPTLADASFYIQAYSNGDAKRLLMSYFNLLPAAGTIPNIRAVPTPSTSAALPNLLEQMRDMLLEYKMTGDVRYKTVYDGTKAWLDTYLTNLSDSLTREADGITADVTSYASANTDMTKIQSDFQTVKSEGPKVEDRYLTVKRQMDQQPIVDTSGAYVKVGITAGLAIGAIVLWLFV